MIRTVAVAAILGATPCIGEADEIRHGSFGNFMRGTYATSEDLCTSNDKSNITIADTKFTMSDDNCAVRWIVETAGRGGNIFFSAHADCSRPDQKQPTVKDVIFSPSGDQRLMIGSSFETLKPYVRCPRGPR